MIGNGGIYQTFIAVDEGVFPPLSCIVQRLIINQDISHWVVKLQGLNVHPQLPNLLDFFADQKYYYLVYELIIGDSLNQVLAKCGNFNEVQIWQFLKTMLPVLQFVHDHQIIHGNIQPKNIIINNCIENLILVNFATSLLLSTNQKTIISDPEYTSPEQINHQPVFSSDLYSLGIICIYLLTQVSPFDFFDINNQPIWQDYLTQKISEYLTQVLQKLINPNIHERWKSTSEVMQYLGIKSGKYDHKSSIFSDMVIIKNDIYSQINTIKFSPDQNILVSGDDDKSIKVWDIVTQKLLFNITGHQQRITTLDFNYDGTILATGSDDKTIKIWNVEKWELIHTFTNHTKVVKSVNFHPYSNILVSGSWDKTIKIWDIEQQQEIFSMEGHKLQINAVVFSPHGDMIASASSDRTVKLWKIEKSSNYHYQIFKILINHTWPVLTVAFSPDGKILASGSSDNTINLWDVNTGELITTLMGHSWSVVTLAFIKDSQILISGSWDKTIKLWDLQTKKEIITINHHTDLITSIDVSRDNLIASSSKDNTIRFYAKAKLRNRL